MLNAVVTGDSYAFFLALAASKMSREDIRAGWLGPANTLYGDFYRRTPDGVEIVDPKLRETVTRSLGGPVLGARMAPRWGLSIGMDAFMIFHDWMWFDYDPPGSKGAPHAISHAALEQIFVNRSRRAVDFALALQDTGAEVFVIAPPLRIDSPFLRLKDRLPVRLAVEMQYRAFVEHRLYKLGVPVLHPPAGTVDESGVVIPSFKLNSPDDLFHCNLDYARLVMEQVAELVDGSAADDEAPAERSASPQTRGRRDASQPTPNSSGARRL